MLDLVFRRNAHHGGTGRDEADQRDNKPKPAAKRGVALALGGGAARGWAHIGVIRALVEADIPITMIAGTSIGALVGGCYLADKLDELEQFALSLTRRGMMRFFDIRWGGGGLIGGARLHRRLAGELADLRIEDLGRPLVCVATEARSGHEVWLDSGSLVLAMRASYALPGVFPPVECNGRRLLDGALVNPVPVSVCRAMEEPLVIAVNLHYDLFGRAAVLRMSAQATASERTAEANRSDPLIGTEPKPVREPDRIGIGRSVVDAFNIIQDRISRSRLAGDPPDYTVHPRVRDIGLSEFFRARECIAYGYEETMRGMAEIERLCHSLPNR
ncbi:patatin-like phospholipase family protein [Aureimonas ureilytica]|uniref:patatin-like phospholipase family protein n=1 Tax=Aureimonas ureilytica TaxID=401562 RepID=UPI00037038AD|nr:patatin-like phospholipase family protein [Aureimonas ureilytica]